MAPSRIGPVVSHSADKCAYIRRNAVKTIESQPCITQCPTTTSKALLRSNGPDFDRPNKRIGYFLAGGMSAAEQNPENPGWYRTEFSNGKRGQISDPLKITIARFESGTA